MMMMMMVSDLSREVEMALTSRWQAVVGDEFDIIVSILHSQTLFSCRHYFIGADMSHCFLFVFWCKGVNVSYSWYKSNTVYCYNLCGANEKVWI